MMNKAQASLTVEANSLTGWIALREAERLDLPSHVGDSWSSNTLLDLPILLSKISGKLVYENFWLTTKSHEVIISSSENVLEITYDRRKIRLGVFGSNRDASINVIESIKELIPPAPRKERLLDVNFWYYTSHGPRSYERQLQAPAWNDIKENYVEKTRQQLAELQKMEHNGNSGKLILWQGDPGTGKTWALRALGEEWSSWCRIHYVLDPEKFFEKGDYLLNVILDEERMQNSDEETKQPWRLVILEDCGELLSKDARQQVGQGLSRLLNLCDGLLGQGLRVLVLITTNEDVGTLHPAIARPGRCLSQIEFAKFSAAEATRWLRAHNSELELSRQAHLAELYALLKGSKTRQQPNVGFIGNN